MTNRADIDTASTLSLAGPPTMVRAAVSMPDTTTTIRHLDTSAAVGAVGWLEVESSAVCGTDVGLYRAGLDSPTVLGHHVVGTVVSVDRTQSAAWDVRPGDRVALEEYLPCMQQDCPACRIGDHRMCPQTDLFVGKRRVGLVPASDGSGLHGGNAEYMQLSANSLVYRLPAELDADLAAWTQPFANALDWTVDAGGAEEGSTVVIIGPGYHGISAVAAARAVGAARIVVIGVPQSAGRLEIAESLGAVPVINDNDDLAELILRATGGEGADVLLDTVGLGGQAVAAAARALRKRGRLVIGGLGSTPVCELDLKSLVRGANTIVGVRGRSPDAVTRSIELLAGGRSGLEIVPSVDVGLDEVDDMLGRMATGQGPVSPHVVIRPQLHRPNTQKRGTLS